mmetsp:Transcript_13872/g.39920  ORF Transcript_13872/g.39920 Transcript_13872/m.39920 type:complete len:231 (-) Transcript_13872:762-1454(-)
MSVGGPRAHVVDRCHAQVVLWVPEVPERGLLGGMVQHLIPQRLEESHDGPDEVPLFLVVAVGHPVEDLVGPLVVLQVFPQRSTRQLPKLDAVRQDMFAQGGQPICGDGRRHQHRVGVLALVHLHAEHGALPADVDGADDTVGIAPAGSPLKHELIVCFEPDVTAAVAAVGGAGGAGGGAGGHLGRVGRLGVVLGCVPTRHQLAARRNTPKLGWSLGEAIEQPIQTLKLEL